MVGSVQEAENMAKVVAIDKNVMACCIDEIKVCTHYDSWRLLNVC